VTGAGRRADWAPFALFDAHPYFSQRKDVQSAEEMFQQAGGTVRRPKRELEEQKGEASDEEVDMTVDTPSPKDNARKKPRVPMGAAATMQDAVLKSQSA
jgi:hypothetical protein